MVRSMVVVGFLFENRKKKKVENVLVSIFNEMYTFN